ncbi:RNA-directed DNA polymerase (Reverse transcriptase) [Rhizobium sp. PDO1-076]|nr:RNA-directed DNA polymerase (Reverse transcriptase) [Rhizobium sp. PDO1-076]
MLHEFDKWLEAKYLSDKARKDRWAWNFGIKQRRPITVRENRQWKPAVAYCRYADDFVVIVKGTKAQAEEIREECRAFLEGELKLTLNMDKTHVVFWKMAHWLGHKYRSRIKPLMRKWYRVPEPGKAKTWLVFGRNERGNPVGKALQRLVSSPKAQFRWRNPEENPYIFWIENRSTVTSHYNDVAMAMGQA